MNILYSMEVLLASLAVIGVFIFIYIRTKDTKSDKEMHRKLRESLEDEFIYDPETGAKITLEQAVSGNWLPADEETRKRNEEEQGKYDTESEAKVREIVNRLKSQGYLSKDLTDGQINTLDATNILSKYDEWSYSHFFVNIDNGGGIFFPDVRIKGSVKGGLSFTGMQLMFWIKIEDHRGHYYFREKTSAEKIMDIIRNDDLIKLDNYETFVAKKGNMIVSTIRLMEKFDNEKGLEIEINASDLFIKTLQFPNIEDLERVEKIISTI